MKNIFAALGDVLRGRSCVRGRMDFRWVACCFACFGCSLWLEPERLQCVTDVDCERRGGDFVGTLCIERACRPNPHWSCTDEARPELAATEQAILRISLVDVASEQTVPAVNGQLCKLADAACESPVAELYSDSDGTIEQPIVGGFEGYLQFEMPGYLPMLYLVPSFIREDSTLEVPMAREELLPELAAALDVHIDPDRGHVILYVEDCFGEMAADVILSSPQAGEDTVRFFVLADGVSTAADATGEVGLGGFINFNPATPAIRAEVKATGRRLRPISLIVRPGYVTVAAVQP